jgi:hypothetical protein
MAPKRLGERVVGQFQNTIQVNKIQNCVSHAYGLVCDVSTTWRGLWQKKAQQHAAGRRFDWYLFKLTHYLGTIYIDICNKLGV